MAKTIKRVGIIFFVLVVSLLVAIGSVFAVNVTSNGDMLLADTSNTANGSNGSSNQNSAGKAEIPQIPTAESEYTLTCDCPDGEPCTCGEKERIWNSAVQESLNNGKTIKVTLGKDWVAKDGDEHSFGVGVGFGNQTKAIYIPDHAKITLDLNGKIIDRKFRELDSSNNSGVVIILHAGVLNIIDSKYNESVNDIADRESLKVIDCGKITGGANQNDGGGIFVGANGVVNFYNGMISNNFSSHGAGVHVDINGTFNMYGGYIVENTGVYGGGLKCMQGAEFNLHNGIIAYNSASTNGGGVYATDANPNRGTIVNMYGGKICKNYATYGGGIYALNYTTFIMKGGVIEDNTADIDAGGVTIYSQAKFEMYYGKITNNSVNYTKASSNAGGGGVMVTHGSIFDMYGGEISNNSLTNNIEGYTVYGSAIMANGGAIVNMYSGIITGNQVKAGGYGAVSALESSSVINLFGQMQIYNNTANNVDSDIYLRKGIKLNIFGRLASDSNVSKMGVTLADDYEGEIFTNGYFIRNDTGNPSFYFYPNNENMVVNKIGREVALQSGSRPSEMCEWQWDGSTSGSSKEPVAYVEYSGQEYVLTNSAGDFHRQNTTSLFSSYSMTEVGSYAFWINSVTTFNSVFTFTILPKEVDVLWKNTDLVYNGGAQKPTAYIAEDPNCKVTTKGEQVDSGSGYIATAIGLSNKNYKINSSTMNKAFSIAKAKVDRPFGNGSFEFDGNEKEFTPNGYNFVTMNISGNKATAVGNYEATISLKDKYNYEWADGGNEDIKLQYAITLAPVVEEDNSVYKFIYLDTEDNTRKTYTEGDLKHGLNDSNVNIKDGNAHYVLGNILPETSVKDFVKTLNYDSTKLKVFNNKGQEVSLTDEVTVVGSGWYIEYTPVAGGAKDTIYLSVLGDVTGDGRIDATDITYLRRIANGEIDKEALNPAVLLAAMVDNRGKITSVDAEILRAICKYETVINKYF